MTTKLLSCPYHCKVHEFNLKMLRNVASNPMDFVHLTSNQYCWL